MRTRPEGIEIRIRTGGGSTRVVVGAGIAFDAGRLVKEVVAPARIHLLSSRRIFAQHGAAIRSSMRRAGLRMTETFVPDGERTKSLAAAKGLYSRLVADGVDRNGCLVVLGGGVLCDLGGFVAGTFHRGIPSVLLPTTLLAQVDAAIGGKTAVNLPEGKNLVGVFHHPRLVVCETGWLATLPPREFRSGLAEIVKIAAALDRRLFASLEREAERLSRRDPGPLPGLIARAVALKARIVARDERDLSGRRAVLNYGHTVGHALESVLGYRGIRHGEAVAIGIAAACQLGRSLGALGYADARRQVGLLERLGLPVRIPPGVSAPALLSHLARDKKARGGRPAFVLTPSVGSASVAPLTSTRSLRRVLVELGAEGR